MHRPSGRGGRAAAFRNLQRVTLPTLGLSLARPVRRGRRLWPAARVSSLCVCVFPITFRRLQHPLGAPFIPSISPVPSAAAATRALSPRHPGGVCASPSQLVRPVAPGRLLNASTPRDRAHLLELLAPLLPPPPPCRGGRLRRRAARVPLQRHPRRPFWPHSSLAPPFPLTARRRLLPPASPARQRPLHGRRRPLPLQETAAASSGAMQGPVGGPWSLSRSSGRLSWRLAPPAPAQPRLHPAHPHRPRLASCGFRAGCAACMCCYTSHVPRRRRLRRQQPRINQLQPPQSRAWANRACM